MISLFKLPGALKLPFSPQDARRPNLRRVLPVVFFGLTAALLLGLAGAQLPADSGVAARGHNDAASQMLRSAQAGWDLTTLFTVGERVGGQIDGYRPPGIFDGMGAMPAAEGKMTVLINHELRAGYGEPYALANGATLSGARISKFLINPATLEAEAGGLAYDAIIDRYGNSVTPAMATAAAASDSPLDLQRLCSAYLVRKGQYGMVDNIYFTGEEIRSGGQLFALDIANETLYAVPAAGRAGYESVALVNSGSPNKIAMLIGDDRQGAPLLLYVGEKDTSTGAGFLERNGLAKGKLYVWVSGKGYASPQDWNGTGRWWNGASSSALGDFVEIAYYDASKAGADGYDAKGYADQDTQDALTAAAGAFEFSRPEDLSTYPADPSGRWVVLASTGRGGAYPSDNWGTTYLIKVAPEDLKAQLDIIYDGDDAGAGQFPGGPDFGLRSPDNLVWAKKDGHIYIQEDRSTVRKENPEENFGGASGREASIWQVDIKTGQLTRIAEMNRSAVLPIGAYDTDPTDLGDWESSGVIDVSEFFPDAAGTTLLVNVQGHSVKGDLYGGDAINQGLVEGGQLLLLQQTR